MNRTGLFAFLVLCSGLLPAALGCTSNVIGGGQGGSGGSGGSQPSGPSGPGGGGSGGSPVTMPAPSGNARPAEGGYIVTLADYPSACGDPGIQPNCGLVPWWSVKFELATANLVPGSVHPFSSDLDGFFSEQLALDAGQTDCGFGAGTFTGGTVEIVSVSAAELVLKVAGTSASPLSNVGLDGTYTVPICDAPTTVDDGNAIAMKYIQTPGNNGDTTVSCTGVGGPFVDPDTLMLFVSNLGQSCTDPYHYQEGCIDSRYQVAIQLPLNLQAVGIYPLGGMANVSLSVGQNSPGTCVGGGGSYWDGKINITAIDPTSVSFTLTGTADIGLGLGNADGTYTAPRCF